MKTLENINIVLAVTGSIAAVECVHLAHELRRRGAQVTAVMSEDACGIISPDSLTYACGTPAITKISGLVEHVLYCGEGGKADLLLIAPSTANTIGKIACGIDDTSVTTFATTAIGRGMPIVLAPAMHESMYRHPAVKKNLETLKSFGITVVPPKMEEEKAKIADIETICLYAERAVSGMPLAGKRVLVSSGSCREELDDVRILTTRSSGKMGRELALEAFRLGAEVCAVSNTKVHGTIPCVENIDITTAKDMHDAVLSRAADADFYLSAAAISDFAPVRAQGKIPSGKETLIILSPLEKLITKIPEISKAKIVGFKLGENSIEEGKKLLAEKNVVMVCANRPETMGSSNAEYTLLEKDREKTVTGTKKEAAKAIWANLL
ncbi:MAG TPA: bifunctional phosphopantothenoylcysteine decarboxylase/phosphopantothenate--cysteine ligase CoaBC [Methanocorpusculum sp.]|nr:bifunctional phosphopantothenoylcysteine decarboxylase/phosphopantothenate--cysteine ligase CoaBC [Methanocorpusculum sp.]